MRLKFASYNIHKGIGLDRRRDPARIIAVLREIDADVIALQEADRRIGERASVLKQVALDDTKWRPADVAKRPRSMGWHGNVLLVRRDIDIVTAEPIDLPMLEPRGAAHAALCCEGRTFRVIGTHLDLSGLRRRDQIKAIVDHVDRAEGHYPTVLMGDFNQWRSTMGAMDEFAPHDPDGWQILDPGRSFPSRQPVARLDRIVVSEEWRNHAAGVHHSNLSAQASDHLPVWADLELPK